MKTVKRNFVVLIIIVGLIALALWSPWQNWHIDFLKLIGIETTNEYATLKIKSLAGEMEIYVDDVFQGTANAEDSDFAEITPITAGEHTITLKRKEDESKYYVLTKKINFDPGVDVVIAYDLGPNEYFSEGHILYSRKNYTQDNKVLLDIKVAPDGSQVYMDNTLIGTAPLNDIELEISKQHILKFVKTGYDPLEITILPEDQASRDKLTGLTLELEVNLFAQPVKINTVVSTDNN